MSKKDKISVYDFITPKQIKRIRKIIDSSANEYSHDMVESLLEDDFTVIGIGTNRTVLISNKKKFSKYIFKVAVDPHGVQANFREFYDSDQSDDLTHSYSISDNGEIVVQERIEPFTSKDIQKKHVFKETTKMLKRLSKKFLLVDCKLTNFRNFGFRGKEVVLCDHGDVVPFSKYQDGKIVDLEEEANVSMTCRSPKPGTEGSKKRKICGGKLHYSKNFDFLKCDRCDRIFAVADAYKSLYTYRSTGSYDANVFLGIDKDFDPKKYMPDDEFESYKSYANSIMKNINKEKHKEDKDMKKTINGVVCITGPGFWLPEHPTKPGAQAKFTAMRRNTITPAEYLKFLGYDPDDFKISMDDHDDLKKERDTLTKDFDDIFNKILYLEKESKVDVEYNPETKTFSTTVDVDELSEGTDTDFYNPEVFRRWIKFIKNGRVYTRINFNKEDGYMEFIWHSDRVGFLNESLTPDERKKLFNEADPDAIEIIQRFASDPNNEFFDDVTYELFGRLITFPKDIDIMETEESESVDETVEDDEDDEVETAALVSDVTTSSEIENSGAVETIEEEEVDESVSDYESDIPKLKTVMSNSEYSELSRKSIGKVDCVLIGKYWVPEELIDAYNEKYNDEPRLVYIPKPKKILKDMGYSLKTFKNIPEPKQEIELVSKSNDDVSVDGIGITNEKITLDPFAYSIVSKEELDDFHKDLMSKFNESDYDKGGWVTISIPEFDELVKKNIPILHSMLRPQEKYSLANIDYLIAGSDFEMSAYFTVKTKTGTEVVYGLCNKKMKDKFLTEESVKLTHMVYMKIVNFIQTEPDTIDEYNRAILDILNLTIHYRRDNGEWSKEFAPVKSFRSIHKNVESPDVYQIFFIMYEYAVEYYRYINENTSVSIKNMTLSGGSSVAVFGINLWSLCNDIMNTFNYELDPELDEYQNIIEFVDTFIDAVAYEFMSELDGNYAQFVQTVFSVITDELAQSDKNAIGYFYKYLNDYDESIISDNYIGNGSFERDLNKLDETIFSYDDDNGDSSETPNINPITLSKLDKDFDIKKTQTFPFVDVSRTSKLLLMPTTSENTYLTIDFNDILKKYGIDVRECNWRFI